MTHHECTVASAQAIHRRPLRDDPAVELMVALSRTFLPGSIAFTVVKLASQRPFHPLGIEELASVIGQYQIHHLRCPSAQGKRYEFEGSHDIFRGASVYQQCNLEAGGTMQKREQTLAA